MADEHVHDWTDDPDDTGTIFVIDTMPPTYTYYCRGCAVVTHDPQTGKPCPVKHYRYLRDPDPISKDGAP